MWRFFEYLGDHPRLLLFLPAPYLGVVWLLLLVSPGVAAFLFRPASFLIFLAPSLTLIGLFGSKRRVAWALDNLDRIALCGIGLFLVLVGGFFALALLLTDEDLSLWVRYGISALSILVVGWGAGWLRVSVFGSREAVDSIMSGCPW